jgi:hypothetical protein
MAGDQGSAGQLNAPIREFDESRRNALRAIWFLGDVHGQFAPLMAQTLRAIPCCK